MSPPLQTRSEALVRLFGRCCQPISVGLGALGVPPPMLLFCPTHGTHDAEAISCYTPLFLLSCGPKEVPMVVVLQEITTSLAHRIGCSQAGGEASKVLCPGVLHNQKKMLVFFQTNSSNKD